ncbi:conserved hypothetical protein [Desulfosarcina cetonica]|nr:conserved hypothetical protein [Desulfosarcina cetonica]
MSTADRFKLTDLISSMQNLFPMLPFPVIPVRELTDAGDAAVTLALDGNLLHDHRGLGFVPGIGAHAADLHDHIQPLGDLAENRVTVVQMGGGPQSHEKLAAVGPRTGVGHGENARAVVLEIGVELILELVARPAGAIAKGTSTLDHESLDDPMEPQPVVKVASPRGLLPSFGQVDEVPDGFRALLGVELDLEGSHVGLENSRGPIDLLLVTLLLVRH